MPGTTGGRLGRQCDRRALASEAPRQWHPALVVASLPPEPLLSDQRLPKSAGGSRVFFVSHCGNEASGVGERISCVGEIATCAVETISCASEMIKTAGETDFWPARRQPALSGTRPALAR